MLEIRLTSQIFSLSKIMHLKIRRILMKASTSKKALQASTKKEKVHAFEAVKIGEYAYTPTFNGQQHLDPTRLNQEAHKIYEWAKSKGATHYSFIAYPHTSSICEKQESFLSLKYIKDENKTNTKEIVEEAFTGKILIKGEGDGSSYPSGGLRSTHTARGYTIWDPLSQVYIRRKKKLLYIPSLLVSHYGHALDDKTLFRQSQQLLKRSTVQLLNKLGVDTKQAVILLGLQQEFFAIPKEAYEKREDLRNLGRALTGNIPARNQQLGQHYYSKIPEKVRAALLDVQRELLQIGIPLKTKHNQVALNQFEIASICNDAGLAIDQNMIIMEIMKEVFNKHDMEVLLHEKPFKEINGSGKHANWSINYVKEDGSLKNLFALDTNDAPQHKQLYKLFILLNLKAVLKHHKLYLTAIATPGNEIRLGGHEAPPRIISVFLGTALSNLIDGKEQLYPRNLQQKISYLNFDVFQQNTDRNRTSPYAYTGNRFEFRALGSSQNPSYAMAVIAATFAQEIASTTERLSKGETLDSIIKQLVEETKAIRFEGNGYSQQWKAQAKRRGLYVNEQFSQIFSFMEKQQNIFERLNICSKQEIHSRAQVAENLYKETVLIQLRTLLQIANKHLIPRGFLHLQSISEDYHSDVLNKEANSFKRLFESVVTAVNQLSSTEIKFEDGLQKFQKLRNSIDQTGDLLTEFTFRLPANKQTTFPDISQFLRM